MTHRFLENSADKDYDSQSQPFASDFDALLQRDMGVVSGCAADANGTGLGVDVTAGTVVVNGNIVAVSAGTPAVTLTAADGSNPRIDLIHVNGSGTIAKTDGTAAAAPVAPALPADVVLLAQIHLPASTTTLTDAMVTDKRIYINRQGTFGDARAGIQYVADWGSDSNDGFTWDTAKASVSAALADIPASPSWPERGGQIIIGNGVFEIDQVEVNKTVRITGLSQRATWLVPQGTYGFKVTASLVTIENLQLSNEAGYDAFEGRAIWIDNDFNCHLDNLWIHDIGDDAYAGGSGYSVAPCAIYVEGNTNFSDWHKMNRLKIANVYRGIVWAGSSNGVISDSDLNADNESLYVVRRTTAESTPGCEVQLSNCWFTGGASAGYQVYLEVDSGAGNDTMCTHFSNCFFERNTTGHHIFCGGDRNSWVGCRWIGGQSGARAIYFDPTEAVVKNVVGAHLLVPGSVDTPSFQGNVFAQEILGRPASEVSSARTLDQTDGIVNVDTSGGAVTITLPDPTGAAILYKAYIVRRDGGSAVTIDPGTNTWSDTGTSADKTLGSDGAAIGVMSVGTSEWKVVSTTGTVT